jgi:hypothetical protein
VTASANEAEGPHRPKARLIALAVAAGLIQVDVAGAQTQTETVGPPTSLFPDVPAAAPAPDPAVAPAPAPVAPPAPEAPPAIEAAPVTEPGPTAPAAPSGIAVEELGSTETDYAGPLDPQAGGLGLGMWQGSSRERVTALLPRLPVSTSPMMQQLARRLLLSSARPPDGPIKGSSLIGPRVERLTAMGRLDDVSALLAGIAARYEDSGLQRARLDAAWLANDPERACGAVDKVTDVAQQDAYWQKSLIFCQLWRKQSREALLGLDLLREQGDQDAAFAALVEKLNGGKAKVEPPAQPTPLHLAMLRAAGVAAPAGVVASAGPVAAVVAARDEKGDPAVRLAAAEQAVLMGALAAETLRALYLAQPATPAEIDSALALADTAPPARGRVLLYKAAERAKQPGARATLIEKALDRARRDGTYALAVQVNLPLMQSVPIAPELSWFAAPAGHALSYIGRPDLANRWRQVAEREAPVDPAIASSLPALQALDALAAGMAPQWDARAIATLGEMQSAPGTGPSDLRAARLAAVAAAVGAPPDGGTVTTVSVAPASAPPTDPQLLADMDDAAVAGRLGETVLLALIALGPEGPGATQPDALRRALGALNTVGLAAEARTLAIEAAVANGA